MINTAFTQSTQKKYTLENFDDKIFAELEQAWSLLTNNSCIQAKSMVEKYMESTDDDVRYNAMKVTGLADFKLKNYEQARRYLQTIATQYGEPDDWFDYSTAAVLSGNIQEGMDAFSEALSEARENPNDCNVPIPEMLFYMLQALRDMNQFQLAFEKLDQLKDIYISMEQTDEHFLYEHGIPHLENTLKAGKKVLENLNRKMVSDWLTDFAERTDESGREEITEFKKTLDSFVNYG